MRLDRFLTRNTDLGRNAVKRALAAGKVWVDEELTRDPYAVVGQFTHVRIEEKVLQDKQAYYFMLHKPTGYVSATKDDLHPTALELIEEAKEVELHIGGRLDRFTSGLLLVTNDGHWSRKITEPKEGIGKVYRVEVEKNIVPETAELFASGMFFECEGKAIQPAQLEVLSEREARLTIYEGLYHQVKRMFHRAGNRVVALHRESMGQICLDTELELGQYRALTPEEISSV